MPRELVAGSIYETKTAAGHFAKGYRSKRFGKTGKPRGSVKVAKVGSYYGVFDCVPTLGSRAGRYISLAEGKRLGKRLYSRRR